MKKIVCYILALTCIFMGLCGCSTNRSVTGIPEESISVAEDETATSDTAAADEKGSYDDVSASEQAKTTHNTTSSERQTTAPTQSPDFFAESTTHDKYKTDPVPDGKPLPKEPESQTVNTTQSYTCTLSIECSSILNNLDMLDSDKADIVPANGVILAPRSVTFYADESVYDVLQRICRENKIHMESSWTPMYNSAYIEGIGNLYEFDCGSGSGWMYSVNGWYPNYGCSRYMLKQGDKVEWRYTCDLGKDIGKS